jgi:hypothetical protein
VASRTTPVPIPVTLPPDAVQDDETWDDIVSGSPAPPSLKGAKGAGAPPSDDSEIFERDTAIPDSPKRDLALELDLSSFPAGPPPPSDPFAGVFSSDPPPPRGPPASPIATRESPKPPAGGGPRRADPLATEPRPPAPAVAAPPITEPPAPPLAPTKVPEARVPERDERDERDPYAVTTRAPRPVGPMKDRDFERAPTEPPEPMRPFRPLPPVPPQRERVEPDRKRTVPEPLVERHLSRVMRDSPPPPIPEPPSFAPSTPRADLELEFDLVSGSSPLDLVDSYRHSVGTPSGEEVAAARERPPSVRDKGNLADMQDRYAVGDFTGALVVAESLLDQDPENEDAKRYAQSCREVLTQMYAARIGPMDQIAVVAVPPEQITWLSLDHRAGFLLSLVDGTLSIEELLDVSGMSRLDALRIMYTLVQQNVITLRQ